MGLSFEDYVGDGSTTLFSVPFGYISRTHVTVTVDTVEVDFTWASASSVELEDAPADDAAVVVRRTTPRTSRLVDFQDANNLTEQELDDSALQFFYISQEVVDQAEDALALADDGKFDARGKVIKSVADPVSAQDAATKNWVETSMDSQVAQAAASAAAASDSEDAAAASEVAAEADRVTVAADKATVAADKAIVATDKAIVATDKATVAADKSLTSGYKDEAEDSRDSAADSASDAAADRVAAEAARDAVLAAYDNFDDRYLGPKATAPTLDNDGNALVGGALYYSTEVGNTGMKLWNGATWEAAYVSGAGYLAAANNLSDVGNAATAFGAIKQAATTSVTGVVEKSSSGENIAGTDDTVFPSVAGAKEIVDTFALRKASNLSDVANAATAFGNIKQNASDTVTGVVELATNAETVTGSDTARATTPAGVAAALATVVAAKTFSHQLFTSNGTWTKPANLLWVEVEVQGPGGGGQGGASSMSGSVSGAGGNAGGYAKKRILAADLGSTEAVVAPAGGSGGANNGNSGSAGAGTASFGSHCSATAGGGAIGTTVGSGSGGHLNRSGQIGSPYGEGGNPRGAGGRGVIGGDGGNGGGPGATGGNAEGSVVIVWEYKSA